ncbi:TonB-dependent receptor family protein [Aureibaculum sp. A20]|uniref:TonB-dependent receptor family protein n=1 Tax=Aureibaculum flavum TaxID=2795986 RepID=A0ABS0WPU4_9FLAO|nr:outer membrane beta-barrel family protein [Aureibaculum flavum]MBJ2173944.1 TonB-dependent receptor family protein [Aureibaculum flavum]
MLRKEITILLIIMCNTLLAQDRYSVKGLVSSQNELVDIGDVLLLSFNEEKLIEYIEIEKGSFNFTDLIKGTYVLKVSCLGFKEFKKVITLDMDLNLNIELTERTTALDEVEITASKKPIENSNGNIIVNVANTIFSSESNPIDLLSKLPKIQISSDRESINIIGKGTALIYLGNQKISFQELENITIDDIQFIEIINNPSSKYEAEGRSVILVHSKFSNKNGIKGTVSETASFRKNYNNFLGGNISYKQNKFELKFNAAFNDLHPWESNGSDYTIINENIESSYVVEADDTKRPQFIFGGGIYYQINKDDYFSLSSTLRSQNDEFLIKTNSNNKKNNIEDHVFTLTDNDDFRFYSSTNLNYNKSFNKTRNLFMGGQYSYYNKELGSDIGNSLNGSEIISDQKRLQDFKVNVISLKADFENEFTNKLKLEIGASMSVTNAKTNAQISMVSPSSDFTTNYDYKEKNYAGYSQLSGKLGKFFYTSGVRAEIMDGKGGFLNNSTLLVDRNNLKLFPKAMLTFAIDSTQKVTLNYAKSISRPIFTTISSSSTYLSPFLDWKGNVELKPTITNEISLNYDFKTYSISASYYLKENPAFYNITYNNVSETSTMSSSNFENEEGFVLELVVPLKYKFWNSTTVIDLTSKKVNDKNAIEFKASPYLYIYSNHQFKIDNTFSASLNGWGYTKHNEGIYKRNGVFAVNASLTKKFFKKLDATLSFNDIFNSLRFKESYNVNSIIANTIFYSDRNEVSISLKYAFGKLKKSVFKNKDVDDNLNRIN